MSRILIIGSLDWDDYETICRGLAVAIETVKKKNPEDKTIVVVHGNAKGADTLATTFVYQFQDYLKEKGYKISEEPHPADWSQGAGGGPRRNQKMVNLGADVCVSFSKGGSRGTASCTRMAKEARIEVLSYTA